MTIVGTVVGNAVGVVVGVMASIALGENVVILEAISAERSSALDWEKFHGLGRQAESLAEEKRDIFDQMMTENWWELDTRPLAVVAKTARMADSGPTALADLAQKETSLRESAQTKAPAQVR